MGELTSFGAVELSSLIRDREISCKEVVLAYTQKIDQINPSVNAIVARVDTQELIDQAERLDQELAEGHWRGPLHGLPQAPKDVMPVKGMVTTRGSAIFSDNLGKSDAIVFERMRSEGAIFLGRSNCPELSLGGNTKNSVYGATGNAFDPAYSAGGSSGGAAVAVALNMLPVADGTDMMGSLRTPAAFNHVYGLRPTFGCVPHGPTEETFFQQFSVAGPIARNVPDLSLLFNCMQGYDARVPLSRGVVPVEKSLRLPDTEFKNTRIGWLGNLGGYLPIDKEVLRVCTLALAHLKSLGCHVDEFTPSFDYASLWRSWLTLRSFNVAGANKAIYDDLEKRKLLKEDAIWEIERGMQLSGSQIYEASKVRTAWYEVTRDMFSRYDYVVMPAAQVQPFELHQDWPHKVGDQPMDTYHRWLEISIYATMAGLPALSAPAGMSQDGLPVGIQIIGSAHTDELLIQLGHGYDLIGQFSKKTTVHPGASAQLLLSKGDFK